MVRTCVPSLHWDHHHWEWASDCMDSINKLHELVGLILEVYHSWGIITMTGWWFGTWIFFSQILGNVMIGTDELHHFSEG